jgi:predicted Fe-Mo cluster-binding NifX family protein
MYILRHSNPKNLVEMHVEIFDTFKEAAQFGISKVPEGLVYEIRWTNNPMVHVKNQIKANKHKK